MVLQKQISRSLHCCAVDVGDEHDGDATGGEHEKDPGEVQRLPSRPYCRPWLTGGRWLDRATVKPRWRP